MSFRGRSSFGGGRSFRGGRGGRGGRGRRGGGRGGGRRFQAPQGPPRSVIRKFLIHSIIILKSDC